MDTPSAVHPRRIALRQRTPVVFFVSAVFSVFMVRSDMQFAAIAFGDGFQVVGTSTSHTVNDQAHPIIETVSKLKLSPDRH